MFSYCCLNFHLQSEVSIKYNKLHADPQQGKSLDIVLKKVKHRLVENMSTTTADALGELRQQYHVFYIKETALGIKSVSRFIKSLHNGQFFAISRWNLSRKTKKKKKNYPPYSNIVWKK